MDRHTAIRQLLSAYLDDRVTSKERREVEVHLASCQRCSAALAELVKTIGHLRNLDRVEPPPWLTGRIMARVREQAAKERASIIRRLFFPLQIKLPLEAVALVFLTVTSYLMIRTMEPELAKVGPPADTRYAKPAPAAPPAAMQDRQTAPAQPVVRKPAATIEETVVPARQADNYEQKRKTAKPAAPAAELKQEGASPLTPTPSAARGMTPDYMSARPAAEPEPARGEITLTVRDASVAAKAIERAVRELGGRIVERESSATSHSTVVAIDSRRQLEFMARLGRLGEVRGKPVSQGRPAGELLFTIKLQTVSVAP